MLFIPTLTVDGSNFEREVIATLRRHDDALTSQGPIIQMDISMLKQQMQILQTTISSALETIAEMAKTIEEREEEHKFLISEIYKLKKEKENG